jgi:glutathione synthase/RimK-type ligase-like ATP-grasp enzyme
VLLAKPSKGRGGQGIFFVKNAKELDQECINEYAYVAQQYIANPFLIENKKFDFRLYLMIKGVEEMEAYIAFEGLVRF